MQREIKFRVWDKKNQYMSKVMTISWRNNKIETLHYSNKGGVYLRENDAILMQYTGLKDVNGKEIYEGDIVKYTYENLEVAFIKGMFRVGYYDLRPDYFTEDGRTLKVIGNIYEHSHLLK